ncbi:PadR family transcriptional regulator [Nocardiopsis sp. CA-288880]|uniref:PadR family transcriptional regulator n=1 Tax=Nocardiopsis sp. CA-288880 TaxID=3239995 RepID=UPI003D96B4E1
MSATRLLVLGAVRIHGGTHGYRVGRELMSWGAKDWANVKWGSIYHALNKLTSEGRLREFVAPGDEEVGRTSYALTDEGEAELRRLMGEALRHAGDDHGLLCAGITLMTSLPRAEAVGLLEERLAALEAASPGLGDAARATDAEWGKPPHVRELFTLWRLTTDAGAEWTRQLIASLEAGKYTMADDSPRAFGLPPVRDDA